MSTVRGELREFKPHLQAGKRGWSCQKRGVGDHMYHDPRYFLCNCHVYRLLLTILRSSRPFGKTILVLVKYPARSRQSPTAPPPKTSPLTATHHAHPNRPRDEIKRESQFPLTTKTYLNPLHPN